MSASPADEEPDTPEAYEPGDTPISRGRPTLENAVFVLLGALAMVLVLVHLVSLLFGW